MRILAIDPGKKRVGVAISDPTGTLATPLVTLEGRDQAKLLDQLEGLVGEHSVERVLVGHPKNMDGTIGPAAKAAQRLARALEERLRVPVELVDERLSSSQARVAMREAGTSPKKARQKVDQMAAVVVLQAYLERNRSS
ncbi:MAG: Holliday junction resolvase RuvX [Candidatus Eremiobacteraeota bacterium]|nr:Holliday junction resolvase RuvX [Candidatus Eremiobacteraeota bacterium]